MSEVQTRRCETTSPPVYDTAGWSRCVRVYGHRDKCVPEFDDLHETILKATSREALALEEQVADLHRRKNELERNRDQAEEMKLR